MVDLQDAGSVCDLLLVTDATASMERYVQALTRSLPQVISVSKLTACFSRIGVLAYRDYNQPTHELLEWSGWYDCKSSAGFSNPDIIAIASSIKSLTSGSNVDWPEAVKTGLAKACSVLNEDGRTTIMVLFADAPPHVRRREFMLPIHNWRKEQDSLADPNSYNGFGPKFCDWVSAATCLRERKVQVFSVLDPGMKSNELCYFNYLSAATDGVCVQLTSGASPHITKVIINVLLAWLQVGKAGTEDPAGALSASIIKYMSLNRLHQLSNETEDLAVPFIDGHARTDTYETDHQHMRRFPMNSKTLKSHVPKRATPVHQFAKRYVEDDLYKALVVEQLSQIIADDVTSMSMNPVFGTLWRTVCNDRSNPARDDLLQAFGLAVDRIANANEKATMKQWLDDSYDYSEEVRELIRSVPEPQRFPCVCLDPTLRFSKGGVDEDGDGDEDATTLARADLLEIGRSCDYKVLRRLGRALTRLTFIESAASLPSHLSAASAEQVPKLPMALASKEFGFKFWKVLLHLLVPGTMLSGRPAAVLAALAMRIGLEPLIPAAERELTAWRNKWNDLSIPETWNLNCLSLLLNADELFRKKHHSTTKHANGLLNEEDRHLFHLLVSYKMLEMNLHTTLTAQVGWTPETSTMPVGPVAECASCKYLRSVTIMGGDNQCGLCLAEDYTDAQEKEYRVHQRASNDAQAWTECGVQGCRAQYVVYGVDSLRARPKCHYCRQESHLPEKARVRPAPAVECCFCSNRMIYPLQYRPRDFDEASFYCIGCASNGPKLVDKETSARSLAAENGSDWLVQDNGVLQPRLENRSVFYTISKTGTEQFSKIAVLPQVPAALTLHGKPIKNPDALRSQLSSWIASRRAESGACSLCFSSVRKRDLLPACGRKGCLQRVDKGCLEAWYGMNKAGSIINTNALLCAFCRRAPTVKTLAAHGAGVHAVGDLRAAVDNAGEWVYAWCAGCGFARPLAERVCAQGQPEGVRGWKCSGCAAAVEVKTRDCPGCGVTTQKVSGCGHLLCTVCHTHWCFFCGQAKAEGEIYAHMDEAHGGFMAGEVSEDGFSDDDMLG